MKRQHFLFLFSIVAIPIAIYAQSHGTPTHDAQQTAFLEPAKVYHIGFPENRHPFSVYNGLACELFRVVRLHENGSWALVEHPASPTDYGTWHLKHSARFLPKHSSEITDEEFANLKETAAREVQLTETWINLDHAVTVKSVSAQSLGLN